MVDFVPYNRRLAVGTAIAVAVLMVVSSCLVAGEGSTAGGSSPAHPGVTPAATASGSPSASSTSQAPAGTCGRTPSESAHLQTVENDPTWAASIEHTKSVAANAVAAGLPARALHLPYLGPIPNQVVNGVPETGVEISSECPDNNATDPAPAPSGIAYDGQSYRGSQLVNDPTLDSNSVLGILNVNSEHNFYPDSATPTLWGGQLNAVLANVTILGHRGYAFWVQNVISYDSHNDTLSMVDDTWNFTTYSSEMEPSSLVSWSPNGSDYTGVWVAFSQTYYVPPPFSAAVYVNSSVNSAGDQVLWYNYSVVSHGHHYFGSYDNLVFRSQRSGTPKPLRPAPFEVSATTSHLVNEGYEFDAFIGADDGSNQLVLAANATEQLKFCSLLDCTPTHYAYANVPAAVNFGSQTGEETVGVDVNYLGTTAYLSAGPLILHGLWNFTGQRGVAPGNTVVRNGITVSGSPVPITAEPYLFVFFKDTAFEGQGFQWASDQATWYLMPGTYRYAILLSDYREQTGTISVGGSTVTLSATLPYSPSSGVYTPLWAFTNAQLAGIASQGNGSISDQYVLFNNPTSGCTHCGSAPNGSLSPLFSSANDYAFKTFSGIFLSGTDRYVNVHAPPSLRVYATGSPSTSFYLNIQFYQTAHVTLSDAAAIRGWPAQSEIGFYFSVPAAQNPAPQGDVYVWNSTHDLIMSNHFDAVTPEPGAVSPDQLVLYGGSDNVVWGNTFRDPTGAPLGVRYAGIGIAESGDLIYNNNFSIDNPVVYLPFNFPNVADCLPQCAQSNLSNTWFYDYPHNTWNVTPQPASRVSKVVNGFSLSGNVLGSGFTVVGAPKLPWQGGNFFWNFGSSHNKGSTIPYVDRFFYSDWSEIYPLGCGTIQAPGTPCGTAPPVVGAFVDGIQFGGDYAPIIPIVLPVHHAAPSAVPPLHPERDGTNLGSGFLQARPESGTARLLARAAALVR